LNIYIAEHPYIGYNGKNNRRVSAVDRECMETQYWDLMVDLRYQIRYGEKYEYKLKTVDCIFTYVPLCVTALTIAAWSCMPAWLTVWVFMLAAAQVIQMLKPLLPNAQRLIALRFYLPELRILIVNMEYRWNCRSKLNDDAFAQALQEDKTVAVTLETKFVGTEMIPTIKPISVEAMNEATIYMESFKETQKGR
jgi:hypothetical protein